MGNRFTDFGHAVPLRGHGLARRDRRGRAGAVPLAPRAAPRRRSSSRARSRYGVGPGALRDGAPRLRSEPRGARGRRAHGPRRGAEFPRDGARLGRAVAAAGVSGGGRSAAVALGLALATKFSAVYLLPILLLQGLLAARRGTQPGPRGRPRGAAVLGGRRRGARRRRRRLRGRHGPDGPGRPAPDHPRDGRAARGAGALPRDRGDRARLSAARALPGRPRVGRAPERGGRRSQLPLREGLGRRVFPSTSSSRSSPRARSRFSR